MFMTYVPAQESHLGCSCLQVKLISQIPEHPHFPEVTPGFAPTPTILTEHVQGVTRDRLLHLEDMPLSE